MRASLIALLYLAAAPAWADDQPALQVSFTRDVVPVLTRAGCNNGACHGSFQGRGGFRLSLLGFDAQADHEAIVREARGRRVFPAVPEQSLLLRKPTGSLAHGGGKRLDPSSESYRILRDWIRRGTPGAGKLEPAITRIEATPSEVLLLAGKQQALRVRATWTDGMTRDVSAWALFESSKDSVAEIDANGNVRARQPGRAAIMVRYLGQVAAVSVTVPQAVAAKTEKWERNNFIDDHISAGWRQGGVEPAPVCDDAEFVRRVYLDLIGTLPAPDEVKRFLANRAADKRTKLIDELLERPEYVDYWALKWADLLRAHRRALGEKGLMSFNGWLKTAIRENRPFDRVTREILTARGNLYKSGAAAFFFVDQTPPELAETTAQVFLGIRLQCAKCHHHPFEVWTQDDYNGLAGFFTRVQRKDTKDDGQYGGAQSISLAPVTVKTKGMGLAAAPRLLGGRPLKLPPEQDPRQVLAEWITDKGNPYFARNIANRYWGLLFGRGLVEPVDDLRASNPASHPGLLDALAKDFTDNGYDLKRLLRTLCGSRSYQLASEVAPKRDADGAFFTHRQPRRLPAEVLLDAINQAAGTAEEFAGLPSGTRAIALPDPAVASQFLDAFGRPKRSNSCECERLNGPDLAQVLHLVNGDRLHQKVTAGKGRVARLLAAKLTDAEVVEELYLATLSRPPSKDEQETVKKLLARAPSRQEGIEDLLWTLLNMAEFACAH